METEATTSAAFNINPRSHPARRNQKQSLTLWPFDSKLLALQIEEKNDVHVVLKDLNSRKDLAILPKAWGNLAFSPDRKLLATQGEVDQAVLFWDVDKAMSTK